MQQLEDEELANASKIVEEKLEESNSQIQKEAVEIKEDKKRKTLLLMLSISSCLGLIAIGVFLSQYFIKPDSSTISPSFDNTNMAEKEIILLIKKANREAFFLYKTLII